VLPLREFSYIKLQALAEDYLDGRCATIDNKQDILECVYEHKSLHVVEELKKMADSICKQKRLDECTNIISLLSAVHNSIQLIRQGRADAAQNETNVFTKAFIDRIEETRHSLIGEQLLVENALHDNPNYYTRYSLTHLLTHSPNHLLTHLVMLNLIP
jgi:hypothetical protein